MHQWLVPTVYRAVKELQLGVTAVGWEVFG